MEPSTASPPGWFADPWDPSAWRYWDGVVWTGYTTGVTQHAPQVVKPPGWFADPFADPWDPSMLRYWDGTTWTDHTSGVGHREASSAMPSVERRWIQVMVGLVVAGVLTVVWGFVRMNSSAYPDAPPTGSSCDSAYEDAVSKFVGQATVAPWVLLLLLAALGTYVFIKGASRRSGRGYGFIVISLLFGWVAVVMLNPLFAVIGSVVGECSNR